jgi:N-acetylmuramoyl-L-alanine amidase
VDLIERPSPNFDERQLPVSMIVLHYTGMPDAQGALDRLTSREAKVSCHYLIDEDGTTYRLVDERKRAWHAGKARWRGTSDVNSASVGIEIVNPGHEFGYRPFPDAQIGAVIELIGDIRSRWTIGDDRIVGHSDVAPGRKEDPGELFPWKRLAEAGHGLWVEAPAAPGQPVAEGEESAAVFALQAGFTRLGYDLPPSGQFDAATKDVVTAFQRHWRQARVDGIADGETRAQLIALLRLAG